MALLNRTSDDLDRLFDALGHPYRRRILAHLAESGGSSEDVLSLEVAVAAGDEFEQVRPALYHAHLPKLDEAGYIRWDRRGETVRRGPRFDDVAPAVRLLADHRDELPGEWS